MLINEVCKITGLTKKAIEYYEEKGLIAPKVEENGYRNFSSEDVAKLKEISVLRKLGLSISEIRDVLEKDNKKAGLTKVKHKKDLELQQYSKKQELLNQLIEGENIDEIMKQLEELEKQQIIKEKLLDAFPGYYGHFLVFHFGRFLNERISSKEQEKAYNNVVKFLDNIKTVEFTAELKEYFEEAVSIVNDELLESVTNEIVKAIENVDDYIEKNKNILEQYIAYKNSEEYKQSSEYKIQNLLLEFQKTSGYFDVFIPNMRKLSPSYDEYFRKLEKANEKFVNRYPETSTWYNE
ncbi:DNA-binding transcriptional MerR regulator [Caldicoprobacter guelmensis]|uniref:MerR family transcriptional regulator n=1 Tax=Caldicoprobacter guelmensis TaxID=1170224 RepID=UPI001958758D|nr:MerR family transcriptional regulator [Caldicoprobacter guelmensis]MBM7582038.1 DNA-binding transcriptional MerR regulator [Caldicoprobacter guelmensis]